VQVHVGGAARDRAAETDLDRGAVGVARRREVGGAADRRGTRSGRGALGGAEPARQRAGAELARLVPPARVWARVPAAGAGRTAAVGAAAARAGASGAAFPFCFAITCCCAASSLACCARSMKPSDTRISAELRVLAGPALFADRRRELVHVIIFRCTARRPSSGAAFGSGIASVSAVRPRR
jgi:hypothetical protein